MRYLLQASFTSEPSESQMLSVIWPSADIRCARALQV